MLSNLTLRLEELRAGQETAAGEIDPSRGSELQDASVRVIIARAIRDRATALGSARASTITKNWMASAFRALGISVIAGAAIFFTVVLLSIYGGAPLFFL